MSEDEIKQIVHQETNNLNLASTAKSSSKNNNVIGSCPKCGKDIIDSPKSKSYFCSGYKDGCDFSIWKTIAGKNISKTIAKELIKTGKTKDKVEGFKSKAGKDFNCKLKLDDDFKVSFDFS